MRQVLSLYLEIRITEVAASLSNWHKWWALDLNLCILGPGSVINALNHSSHTTDVIFCC